MKRKNVSIRRKILSIVLCPIVILAILIVVFGIFAIYGFYSKSTYDELAATTNMMMDCLNLTVRGDYQYEDGMLLKGDINITDSTMLYRIKEKSQIDTTIFWGDTRILTTVEDKYGVSAVGTQASDVVVEHVLENGEDYFSRNVKVDGLTYIGYYVPVQNSDHKVVGMIFAGKNKLLIYKNVGKVILCFVLFSIVSVIIAVIVSGKFSSQVTMDIDYINQYLKKISEGDLSVEMEESVDHRGDEVGEIGRYAVKMKNDLQKLIEMDPLTGLYNRRSCNRKLKAITEAKTPFTIVMCDIDWFKKINDHYGHDAGDYVLVKISEMIRNSAKDCGFASRWGGEEFLLIYTESFENALSKVEALQQQVRDYEYMYGEELIKVTMTFGVTESDRESNYEDLITAADHKLYSGKRNGRNQIVS